MLIVGERLNSTRPPIQSAMARRDGEFLVDEARRQWEAGARYLDVNTATMLDAEVPCLTWLVRLVQDVHAGGLTLLVIEHNMRVITAVAQRIVALFLGQVIADAVNLVRPQKESRAVAIEVEVEPGLPHVAGRQQRLTQVLLNLLLNAVDALEGRGTVRIEARAARAGGCVLQVTDDGPGLPDTGDLREGLGLANTRLRLRESYGDRQRFELANAGDGGLRVVLEIPLRLEDGPDGGADPGD